MPRDRAALIRTGMMPPKQPGQRDTRVHVDLAHLRAVGVGARGLRFLPRQPARSVLNGRHASRLRGRGLNFEELRDYLPGDDVRSIDWKVTARTGTPHVRVMTEERDRPALIVVDQRMSMFFGSVLNMKSVTAAEVATLAAFGLLDQGDRIGGIVFGDRVLAELRPQRSQAALNRFLAALAEANGLLHAEAPAERPIGLTPVLSAVARIAPRNHLIFIISDFDGLDDGTDRAISGLARRNDLVLLPVSDPIAHDLPEDLQLVVSDGTLQAQVDGTQTDVRDRLAAFASGRLAKVLDWERRYGVPVLPLSAGAETLPQVRGLMGLRTR